MRAALYCRVSREDGGTDQSIDNQKSMLLRFAADRGDEVVRVYVDENRSGQDRDRPAFCRMLREAEQGRFDVILVKTLSRFARDSELIEAYLHGCFAQWGIRLIAAAEHADTKDASNLKFRQLSGLISAWYPEEVSASVRAVLTHRRRQGRSIASFAPYGYIKDERERGRLLVDPDAAAVVRRIFALYLKGFGPAGIAERLNGEGIPPPSQHRRGALFCASGGQWGKSSVSRILSNRTYAGDMEQGRRRKADCRSKRCLCLPREEWIIAPGAHEPLVDRSAFEQVQRMRLPRVRGGENGRIDPLAGKVFCGLCGAPMRQTSAGRRYFRCETERSLCPGQPSAPAVALAAATGAAILSRIASCRRAQALFAQAAAAPRSPREPTVRRLEEKLEQRRKALEALGRDLCGGAADDALAQSLMLSFQQEELELKRRLALARAEQQEGTEAPGRYGAAPGAPDRTLVCLLVERIVVFPPDKQTGARRVELRWLF